MHIREFIDSNFVSDSMLNNVLGPVVFFEVQSGKIKVTRVNEQYFQMIGAEHFKEDIQKEFLARIPAEERSQFNEMLENSFLNPVSGADGMLHLLRTETDKLTVYINVFYMLEKEEWKQLDHVCIAGVMGMATNTDDETQIEQEFHTLKALFDEWKQTFFASCPDFKEISMGMSHDYPIAVRAGSTMIREGSKIFGERVYTINK